MLGYETFLYALIGGIIPAVFWLHFWLKEDTHREPRGKIAGVFLAGMFVVIIAIPLERGSLSFFREYSFPLFIVWAFIEEGLKFLAAYFIAIRTRFNNEPIDATIYLMTSALGFAALENVLFLLEPINQSGVLHGAVTLNLRFIGATLLHVICSGIIGIIIGLCFYNKKHHKKICVFLGLLLATLLHALFNTFIIKLEGNLLVVFSSVWIGVVAVILILERIKKIKQIY